VAVLVEILASRPVSNIALLFIQKIEEAKDPNHPQEWISLMKNFRLYISVTQDLVLAKKTTDILCE
jgi:hypothetical protein